MAAAAPCLVLYGLCSDLITAIITTRRRDSYRLILIKHY